MIGYSGLTAAQASSNTTANNIANINTKGYSRQELHQEAAAALRTYTRYGMAGSGVDAKSIDQIRDQYIDMKWRINQTTLGEYSRKNSYMGEIENYFTDTTIVPGFNSVYVEDFYNALSKLEDDPGSTTTRQSFIGAASSVVEYFQTMATDLSKTQENVNMEIKDVVDKINSIAAQVASINKQINVIEIRGVVANELRDQRNNLID
ncbi:MAG TPA: flagellar hook-associated protein FlgK, partial [Lachnospiraceae bacterium]|nr:flagellar hook-associated protein FlgK [Lachnospiraceae bacterium]